MVLCLGRWYASDRVLVLSRHKQWNIATWQCVVSGCYVMHAHFALGCPCRWVWRCFGSPALQYQWCQCSQGTLTFQLQPHTHAHSTHAEETYQWNDWKHIAGSQCTLAHMLTCGTSCHGNQQPWPECAEKTWHSIFSRQKRLDARDTSWVDKTNVWLAPE